VRSMGCLSCSPTLLSFFSRGKKKKGGKRGEREKKKGGGLKELENARPTTSMLFLSLKKKKRGGGGKGKETGPQWTALVSTVRSLLNQLSARGGERRGRGRGKKGRNDAMV